jgi:hypothetical protein
MGSVIEDKLVPVLTDIGKQKAFQADLQGLKINITHIAIGSGRYEPTKERTTLEEEKLRVEIMSSEMDRENYQITLNSIFKDEEKEFWITEVGFFLDDGTLFAVWSDEERALSYKSIFSKPIFAFTLKLVDVNIDSINIIDNGLDLKLNYLNEFISFGVTSLRLNRLIAQAFDEIKALAKSSTEALESVKGAIWKKINEIDNRFFARKKEVDSLLLANAISIIRNIKSQIQIQDDIRSYIDSQNSIQNEIAYDRYSVTLANSIAITRLTQQGV